MKQQRGLTIFGRHCECPMAALANLISSIEKEDSKKYSWSNNAGTPLATLRQAAVLVPIVLRDGDLHVWLTLRSDKVSHDQGHVSFPGGMKDDCDDSEVDTCLRESEEEIGLGKQHVQIIGQLYPRINARGILITPVIGVVSNDFIPNNNEEVELSFELPLKRFLSADGHHSNPYSVRDIDMLIHFFTNDINGKDIQTWGLTATICLEIAVCIFGQAPEFQYETDTYKMSISSPFKHQEQYLDLFIKRYIDEQGKVAKQIQSKL